MDVLKSICGDIQDSIERGEEICFDYDAGVVDGEKQGRVKSALDCIRGSMGKNFFALGIKYTKASGLYRATLEYEDSDHIYEYACGWSIDIHEAVKSSAKNLVEKVLR